MNQLNGGPLIGPNENILIYLPMDPKLGLGNCILLMDPGLGHRKLFTSLKPQNWGYFLPMDPKLGLGNCILLMDPGLGHRKLFSLKPQIGDISSFIYLRATECLRVFTPLLAIPKTLKGLNAHTMHYHTCTYNCFGHIVLPRIHHAPLLY